MLCNFVAQLTLTTLALYHCSLRWFGACSCKPGPRGLSPHLLCSLVAHYLPSTLRFSRLKNRGFGDHTLLFPYLEVRLGCGKISSLFRVPNTDTVLDLGSGAGFDCFLAAAQVGNNGRVTPTGTILIICSPGSSASR